MGTTADKLSYLKETKTQIKEALETDDLIFRNYPDYIKKLVDERDKFKANQQTSTFEGQNIELTDSANTPIEDVQLLGVLKQEDTLGEIYGLGNNTAGTNIVETKVQNSDKTQSQTYDVNFNGLVLYEGEKPYWEGDKLYYDKKWNTTTVEDTITSTTVDDNLDEGEVYSTNSQAIMHGNTIVLDTIEKQIQAKFALTPDDGVYGVKFPLWATSTTVEGEKYGANEGKTLTLATDTVEETTNYGEAFETYDVNAYVDDDGEIHITAIKGDSNFKDTGDVDVYVLIRTYYEKYYEQDGYAYYERTYTKKDGYTPVSQAIRKDGSIRPFFLIGKYECSKGSDGKLYSTKGKAPSRNNSYQNCATNFHTKGTYCSAGLAADYKHIQTTIWLKFATRNSSSVIRGVTSFNYQYLVAETETDVKRVVLTSSQAANFDLYTCVSVGDVTTNTNLDRRSKLYAQYCR